jgi:hypothetical protein
LVSHQYDLAKAYVLEVGTVHAHRLQAHFFELRANVFGCDLETTGASLAALHQIIGKEGHVRPKTLGADAPQEFFRREIGRSRMGGDEDEKDSKNQTEKNKCAL